MSPILLSFSWAWYKFEQAINRVHRMTSPKPVKVWSIVANGTIDRRLESLLPEKGDSAELVLDGKLLGERTEEVNLAEVLSSAASEFDASSGTLTLNSDSQLLSWMAQAPSMSTDSRSGMLESAAMSVADVETRYRDLLWALVSLDLEPGELVVESRRAVWVDPDP